MKAAIAFAALVAGSEALAGASPTPLPRDEAAWLHATCVQHPGEDGGSGQPTAATRLSPCVVSDGKNKIHWGIFRTEKETVYCRFGVDDCPRGLSQADALVQVFEEFSCSKGRKHGAYQGSVSHKYLSQPIYYVRVEANYAAGKLDGESRHFFRDGTKCRVHKYKNGRLEGVSRKFSGRNAENVVQEINYKDGLRHGKATFYAKNGSVRRVEHYDSGELHGDVVTYDPKGTPETTTIFRHGTVVQRSEKQPGGSTLVLSREQLEARDRENAKRDYVYTGRRTTLIPLVGLSYGSVNDVQTDDQDGDRVVGSSPGLQLFLGDIGCQDFACAGYMGSLGVARSVIDDDPLYFSELGLGIMAIYVNVYLGGGVRYDAERTGVQATGSLGIFFTSLYARIMAYPKQSQAAFEGGLQVIIPLGAP